MASGFRCSRRLLASRRRPPPTARWPRWPDSTACRGGGCTAGPVPEVISQKKVGLIYEFQKSLKNQHPSFFEIGNTRPIAGSTRVFSRGPVPTQAACSRLGRARDLPADPHPTRRQLGCKENGFEVVFQASCWPIFVCLFSHFLVTFEQILI